MAFKLCCMILVLVAGGVFFQDKNCFSKTITNVASDTAAAGSFGYEQVTCPDGKIAIGGGVDPENVLVMEVSSSAPVFDDGRLWFRPNGTASAPTGWQASVINNTGTSLSFKFAAICAPINNVTTVISSDTAAAGSFGYEQVTCPDGKIAIGGGVDPENVLVMEVSSSSPIFDDGILIGQPDGTTSAPTGWQASVINNTGTSQSFKVAAICAPINNVTTVISSDTAAADSFGVERVACPDGKIAIGGGVDPENVLTMKVSSSAPVFSDSRLLSQDDGTTSAPTGWQASVINNAGTTQSFKVATICSPPLSFNWNLFLPAIIEQQ